MEIKNIIRAATLAARDMNPYQDILFNAAKYFKAGENINILEIGVRRGVSTRAFIKALRNRIGGGHLYSIDKTDRSRVIRNQDDLKLWTFIHGKSGEIDWNKKIDILFIDGDHSYEGAKGDYEKYEPFVKNGGLIFMHDVTHKHFGVKDFWPEIKYQKANLAFNSIGMGVINKQYICQKCGYNLSDDVMVDYNTLLYCSNKNCEDYKKFPKI